TDTSTDIVIGDNGSIDFDANGFLVYLETIDETSGGDDLILVGDGSDVVLGGSGADSVNIDPLTEQVIGVDSGNDVILGDNGFATFEIVNGVRILRTIETSDPLLGDDDLIFAGDGSDVVLGGDGADRIDAGTDASRDVVVGDHGVAEFDSQGLLQQVTTTQPDIGGDDRIQVGDGDDVVLGGFGNDFVDIDPDTLQPIGSDQGDDVVLGDNGVAQFDTASGQMILTHIHTTEPLFGGNDSIFTDSGADIVLGGAGNDLINAGLPERGDVERDIVLGDHGWVDFTTTGELIQIYTTDPAIGGDDVITTGGGDDVILGGAGADNAQSGTDNDLILGDNGILTFNPPGTLSIARTTDPSIGGNDVLDAGPGQDAVFGGAADDEIYGGDGRDILFGDNGVVDYLIRDNDPSTFDVLNVTDPLEGGADRIYGGAQEDVIFGATGDDQIWGGPDHDLLFGDHGMWDRARPVNERAISTYIDDNSGAGNDTIHGDEGDDFIWGQQGDDHLFGDDGEDDITGGHNVVGGSDGADTIDGGADADVVLGDNGQILRTLLTNRDNAWKRYPAPFADVIRQINRFDDEDRVGAGDTIEGGDGDDILHGQRGDDIMSGGAGDDEMIGELGNDTMSGGADNDILLGDVGQILRDFTPMGQPRVNENGSWHRDIVLEDVASVSGLINADMTPLQVNDPNLASKLMKSDLVIATGAHDANGNKIKNSANQAWDVDLLLVNLVAANNDTLDGGDGQDLVFGQRGNDIVAGGSGDDLVVGDNAVNLTPFDTELPHITRTIRLLEADNGVTVPFTFDARGNVISSPIELTPHEMSLNEPFWLTDTYANIASPTVDRMLDQVGAHELARTDGAKLTSLFTVIPDVLHHTDVLPGNDTVRGDAGDDLVVGDNAQFYSPLLTGFTPIDNATSDVQKYFQLLMYTMRSLGIDFEQLQAAQGASQVAHDIHVASDDVQGGTGNDRVLGDDGVFVIAPQLGLPVSEAELQRTATALLTYLQDLQTAATDMEHVAFEAHYQTLNTLLVTPGATAKPNLHDLYIGNDVIAGDEGNDTISGDQALLMMPVITGVRTELIRDNSHISTSVWDTVADSLLSADMLFRAKLNTHLSADHDKLNRTLNATQLAQLPPDYDYELFVGNDTIDAGDGNDLVLGDFAVDSIPISLTLPKTDIERFEQKQDVRELMDDMELFLERWHHPNDLSAWQSSYDHARFDERTGA
ncbi:MAG: hypothetical protein KDB23_22165, partial [Planctomycetales bacterium]|nr:hypothetical protein [Planctomycetales bacterium]